MKRVITTEAVKKPCIHEEGTEDDSESLGSTDTWSTTQSVQSDEDSNGNLRGFITDDDVIEDVHTDRHGSILIIKN